MDDLPPSERLHAVVEDFDRQQPETDKVTARRIGQTSLLVAGESEEQAVEDAPASFDPEGLSTKERQELIGSAHQFLTDFSVGIAPLKKLKDRKRELGERRVFSELAPPEWRASELVETPAKARILIESWMANGVVPDPAQRSAIEHIKGSVARELERGGRVVAPEQYARMFQATAHAQHNDKLYSHMSDSFIRPLVDRNVRGSGVAIVEEMHKMARGLCLLVDDVDALTFGARLLQAELPEILPEDHEFLEKFRFAFYRVDSPTTVIKYHAINEALKAIAAQVDTPEVTFAKRLRTKDNPNQVSVAPVEEDDVALQALLAISTPQNPGTSASATKSAPSLEGVRNSTRNAEMSEQNQVNANLSIPEQEALDRLWGEYLYLKATVKSYEDLREELCQHFPDHAAYIDAAVDADETDELQIQVARTFPGYKAMLMRIRNGESHLLTPEQRESIPIGEKPDSEVNPEYLGILYGQMAEAPGYVDVVVGDYVIEVCRWGLLGVGLDINTPAQILRTYFSEAAIQSAIDELDIFTTAAPIMGEGDLAGWPYIMRPLTEIDKRRLHPLNVLCLPGSFPTIDSLEGISRQEIDSEIEKIAARVAVERHRFMNNRGIRTTLTSITGEDMVSAEISIKKHPDNPQYYAVTVTNGAGMTAKAVMDRNLRISLGSSRIHSPEIFAALNYAAARLLQEYLCQAVVETEEGQLVEGKNTLTQRIAYLRRLKPNERFSRKAWLNCLEHEGEDLAVLSRNRQIALGTDLVSTYVPAKESDDDTKEPLRITLSI